MRSFQTRFVLLTSLIVLLVAACGAPSTPPSAPAANEAAPTTAATAAADAPAATSAATAAAAPAATAAAPAASGEPTRIVIAHTGPIYTMDAPVTWYGSTHWLANLLYDCLIWRNPDGGGYYGQAAERWENTAPDKWVFNLRPGATFQNGEPLNAEAVKWNIDRVRTREDFLVHPQWQFVKEVNVIDETTVEVVTDGPKAYTEYDISYNGCQLLPPGYMEEVGEEAFAQAPIGSGPYRLREFTEGERYVFEKWDGYTGVDTPMVDEIIYQVIPEVSSQVAALLSGQVDVIVNTPIPDRERIEAADGLKIVRGPAGQHHILYARLDATTGELGVQEPDIQLTTASKEIRQAIYHAIDRTLLAEIQGSATPSLVRINGVFPEVPAKYVGPEAANEVYNPDRARELIAQAGYDPAAGNAPRLTFHAPSSAANEKEVAEAIEIMLEEVGFEVDLQILENAAFSEQIQRPGLNRELMMTTLGGSPSLVPQFFQCNWPGVNNHVCIPEWDALSNEILGEVDATRRNQLWEQWWETWLDVSPEIALYQIDRFYGMNEKVDWQPRADGWMTFRNARVITP